jgi:hypothetical protein
VMQCVFAPTKQRSALCVDSEQTTKRKNKLT